MTNHTSLRRWLALGASAMAFGAMAAPAMAADASAAAGAAAQDQATTIDTLVVTAEKREQSLQDVPIAISAFGAKQRDLKGINTVQDMTNFTPGLVYSSSNDRASVRGVGRLTNVHAVDAAVAIYIDGVYTTSTVLAGGPPLMVDRVEVLRGPQGTLYGRNSIGGTINILSPHPTNHWYGEVRAIGENYGYSDFQGVISGPITDNLKFRLSGYKKDQREGYFHNVVPGMPTEGAKRNEYAVELQGEATLGDKLTLWGKIGTLHWDNRGGPGARAGIGPVGGPPYEEALIDPNFSVVFNPAFGYSAGATNLVNLGTTTVNPAATDPRAFNTNTPLSVKLQGVFLSSWNVKYSFPTFDLKYIGGWQKYHYSLHGDLDGTAVQSYTIPLAPNSICGTIHTAYLGHVSPTDCQALNVSGTTTYDYQELPTWWSHEINLTSTTDGPLQWIMGAYYYHESYSNPYNFYQPNQPQLQTSLNLGLFGLGGGAANPDGGFSYSNYNMVTKSTAVFGQVDYKVTDTLKFTVGLRYTRDTKYGTESKRVLSFSPTGFADTPVSYTLTNNGTTPVATGPNGAIYAVPGSSGLYSSFGLSPFGPGSAANWGSLYGNFAALPAILSSLNANPGGAYNFLAALGSGAFDLTKTLAPKTTVAGAPGVCGTPTYVSGTTYTQYTIDPTTGMLTRSLCDSSSATTGTAGVEWTPSSDLLVYGRYSRGYKAFGLSAGGGLTNPEAKPENVDSFEIGFKKDFGHTLQFNLAAFYYNYTNLQAPVSARVGTTNVTQFVNIAQSRSMGVEIDAVWQPIDHLQLSLDYSYNPTKILKADQFIDLNDNTNYGTTAFPVYGVPVSVVGNKLPQAPENKIAINGNYTFVLDQGKLNVGANFIWRGSAYSNIFSQRWNQSPSWNQVDLRASWTPTQGRYQVIVYVKNVGNTLGYDSAVTASNRDVTNFPVNTGYNTSFTPPRTYGIEVHYKFF
ncbi:TonB-dependent receptor [Caulobacter sp. KR2-114]|uniref:TonB-dependent receptor n=1 Tax=Caulobacter sp. KR2-114 TaxID=3400912 RepID=UPI003C0C8E69